MLEEYRTLTQVRENEQAEGRGFVRECLLDASLQHVYEPLMEACIHQRAFEDGGVNELLWLLLSAAPADFDDLAARFRLDGTARVVGGKLRFPPVDAATLPPAVRAQMGHHAEMAYHEAITLFRGLMLYRTPQQKCRLVQRTLRALSEAPAAYYRELLQGDKGAMGADDMLPVFQFVITRSRASSLLANILFMDTFLSERLQMGADGFAMASLTMAVNVLKKRAPTAFRLRHLEG